MRDSLIERILALTDEQFELLVALLQELEEEQILQSPHRESA